MKRFNQLKELVHALEGDFEKYNPQRGRIDKKTLYSALITLNYYKGFSVMRTYARIKFRIFYDIIYDEFPTFT